MSASTHAKKRLFTSIILAISLVWCLIGGAAAYPYPIIIISGDTPVSVQEGVSVGEIIQGEVAADGRAIINTRVEVETDS